VRKIKHNNSTFVYVKHGRKNRSVISLFNLLGTFCTKYFPWQGLAGKEREFSSNFSEKKRLVLIAVSGIGIINKSLKRIYNTGYVLNGKHSRAVRY
jgi:hypothetical protein